MWPFRPWLEGLNETSFSTVMRIAWSTAPWHLQIARLWEFSHLQSICGQREEVVDGELQKKATGSGSGGPFLIPNPVPHKQHWAMCDSEALSPPGGCIAYRELLRWLLVRHDRDFYRPRLFYFSKGFEPAHGQKAFLTVCSLICSTVACSRSISCKKKVPNLSIHRVEAKLLQGILEVASAGLGRVGNVPSHVH